jgi:Undecaprenyl-phosphate galactose phosphotransferase WbaP
VVSVHQANLRSTSLIARPNPDPIKKSTALTTLWTLVLTDIATLIFSVVVAVAIRFCLSDVLPTRSYWIAIPLLIVSATVFWSFGLYSGTPEDPIGEFKKLLRATTITYLMIISVTFFTKEGLYYSRSTVLLAWLLTTLLMPASRSAMRKWCSRQSWWGIPTVILGAGKAGQEMLKMLQKQQAIGLRPIAVLDHYSEIKESAVRRAPNVFWGDLSYAAEFASNCKPCFAIIAMPELESEQLSAFIRDYAEEFYRVLVIPELFGIANLEVHAKDFCGVLGLEFSKNHSDLVPQVIKRTFDLVIAGSITTFFLPIFAAIYLHARFTSSGPIFYGQRRIGRDGKEFTAWKFRTMVMNADAVLEQHLRDNPMLRHEWNVDHKLKKDPRVTPLGKFLRKFSLDELPQLWNVICGHMSLVGPRPIVWAEAHRYGQRFAQYQKVQPGLTGLWQISGRNNTTYEERTRLDEYYVRHWSILLDLYILLRTVRTVITAEGAY